MIVDFIRNLIHTDPLQEMDYLMDAEYETVRDNLMLAGLSEEELRGMDPDDRVAALEEAELDPYDYIYLDC